MAPAVAAKTTTKMVMLACALLCDMEFDKREEEKGMGGKCVGF